MFNEDNAIALIEASESNPFPVNFDDAWQWLGYSRKDNALSALLSFGFSENADFLITQENSGGRPTKNYSLSVDCFKDWAMMSQTVQGKEVRTYFRECERIAKESVRATKGMTQIQMIALVAQQMADQEQKLLAQEKELASQKQIQSEILDRIECIEVEQDRTGTPCGHKYSVVGFAALHDMAISAREASTKGRKASALCRSLGLDIETIHDPRFGKVGLYPESILSEVFGII